MDRLAALDGALAHIQSTSSASVEGAAEAKHATLRVANDLFGADAESRELLDVPRAASFFCAARER